MLGGDSSNIESSGALWDLKLPVAPDLNESKTVSLWKSISSSSPDVNPRISLSDPISVEARSVSSEVRGGFDIAEPTKDIDAGDACPVDDTDGDVVDVCTTGELGLRRGADEDDEDNPSRARSTLKLDSRVSGGNGEELLRLRLAKLVAKGSLGEASSVGDTGDLWKTFGSMIGRCLLVVEPCAVEMLRPGIVDTTGADE